MFETGWNLGEVKPQRASSDKRNKKRTQVPYAEKKKRKLNNNLKISKNQESKNKPKKYAQSIKGEKLKECQVEQNNQLINSKKSKLKVIFVIKMDL